VHGRKSNFSLPAALKAVAECATAVRQQLIVIARGSNIHLTSLNKNPLTMFGCVSPHMCLVVYLPTNPNCRPQPRVRNVEPSADTLLNERDAVLAAESTCDAERSNNERRRTMRKLILTISLMIAGFAHAQTTVTLTAPNILGVSCGGYQSGSKVTLVGFDANGNLQATVYEIMSCSSGGRGSPPRRYTGTSVVTWDFRGGVITSYDAPLAIPAGGTSAVDSYGNVATLGNPNFLQVALTIHQMPPNPNYVEALVPNLIGDTDAVAQAAIAAAGLVDGGAYINYSYAAPAGTVFNQQPLPGKLVPFGTVVGLWETPASSGGGGG